MGEAAAAVCSCSKTGITGGQHKLQLFLCDVNLSSAFVCEHTSVVEPSTRSNPDNTEVLQKQPNAN